MLARFEVALFDVECGDSSPLWVCGVAALCFFCRVGAALEAERKQRQTPAMKAPQARELIAVVLEEHLQANTLRHKAETAQRWLMRNELTRAAYYKARNLLPPEREPPKTGSGQST